MENGLVMGLKSALPVAARSANELLVVGIGKKGSPDYARSNADMK
jgi:predicted urease superfamily metal-dependent hydrolase